MGIGTMILSSGGAFNCTTEELKLINNGLNNQDEFLLIVPLRN